MSDPFETDAFAAKSQSAPSDVPNLIGRYRVEKILGEGAFGRVYLAQDEQLNRAVAIKVPRPERISRPSDAEAYLTEARTVASLDHPNIVPIFDVGTTHDGLCFVVSKVIEGSDLASKIRQTRPAIVTSATWIAILAEALHYAHRKKLVHRDIKPANILIDHDNKPYIADFGLALTEEDFGKGARRAGTPAYMSPEQARGEGHRIDGRSDIFSLGVVFYEMLVGQRPFKANTLEELLEQISTLDARPPRQLDDRIPKELERICLKALAKRATDRYTTAKDFAEDLQHFLAAETPEERGATPKASSESATPTPIPNTTPTPASDSEQIRIVPKGLRSFDAKDSDFFLDLLPGPRDREGLPESIRFWKSRIEEKVADQSFAVGLVYGPSGCGKSSLMKAGLLPRLPNQIVVNYLEATAAETEVRLLKGLRRQVPGLPENLGLVDTLAAIRQGRFLETGKKILLVLDQFEQWLHAKQIEENAELVQALRQCEAGRVQAIVMVRDDFWLAVSRFMQILEIRILEEENSKLVDLFDLRHARKVLSAFGRAFGNLPEHEKDLSNEQRLFLDQAVEGLAQEGKVISVRLALFAEMMKGKDWTPAALNAVGGTEGVGVTFLDETFSATTAPPEHRLHQQAARAVLKSLLPEAGTDIKGHMRSREELLEASGYGKSPRDFENLLRILDSEVRLLTPTDPDGKASDESSMKVQAGAKYYQLTHDYLVPSLRDWLTRKQKETRKGRAELLLADRAAVWTARSENRQLPSLWQWAQVKWHVAKKTWTSPQRKMMRTATRYHVVRGLTLVALVALLGFVGYEGHGRIQAHSLCSRLLDADINEIPKIVDDMASYRPWLDRRLRDAWDQADTSKDPRKQKLHTSLALLPADVTQVEYLYGRLLEAEAAEVPIIRDALNEHKGDLLNKLWTILDSPKGMDAQRLRAGSALAKYDPENEKWAKASTPLVDALVLENAVFLGLWTEAFRPVKGRLLDPLKRIYHDHQLEHAAERKLATNLLTDYASDLLKVLADLLMDADEPQFAKVYPKVSEHGEQAVVELLAELSKQTKLLDNMIVFESKGTIAEDDPKVKIKQQTIAMPAKRFEVVLEADKKYRITMDSNDLDPFLILQDKTGKQLAFDDDSGGGLNSLLDYTPSNKETYVVFAAALEKTGTFALKIIEIRAGDDGKEALAKRQANAAVALLRMNRPERVWPLLKHSPDPRVRSYLIHRLNPLGADAGAIIQRLDVETDVSIRRALLLSLGEYGVEKSLLPTLQKIYQEDPDPGLHGAAEWLLRTWKQDDWIKQVNDEWASLQDDRDKRLEGIQKDLASRTPKWFVNSQGQTMVVIPSYEPFEMGSPPTEAGRGGDETLHKRQLGRTFALAAKSVTYDQFNQYHKKSLKINYNTEPKYDTRLPDLPVIAITWFQAAAYCNWLSQEEGLDPCYEIAGQVTKMMPNYLRLSGYRLPTEAEMEYATRAGATTSRYFGETEELLPNYAWYLQNSKQLTASVGKLKPNDFGLFDIQGNVYNWCQDKYDDYKTAAEDTLNSIGVKTDGRVLRGGSFLNQASTVRSAYRYLSTPTFRNTNFGFRLARTLTH